MMGVEWVGELRPANAAEGDIWTSPVGRFILRDGEWQPYPWAQDLPENQPKEAEPDE